MVTLIFLKGLGGYHTEVINFYISDFPFVMFAWIKYLFVFFNDKAFIDKFKQMALPVISLARFVSCILPVISLALWSL